MGNLQSCFVSQEERVHQLITEDSAYYSNRKVKSNKICERTVLLLNSDANMNKLIRLQNFFRLKFAQYKFKQYISELFKIVTNSLQPFLIEEKENYISKNQGELLYRKLKTKFFDTNTTEEICRKKINKNISPFIIKYPLVYLKGFNSAYEGSWNIMGQFEGYGILYSNNSRVEGYWHKGELNGFGLSFNNKNEFYRGFFEHSKSKGKGELYNTLTDSFYIGELYDNIPNGNGKEIFCSDNSTFEGEFREGKKIKGKYSWSDGSVYQGGIENDLFHGYGEYQWLRSGIHYEGNWVYGSIEGKGKMTYEDGAVYEGEFKDGVRNGFGKYTWNRNKYYEGEWSKGKQNGKGVYIKNGVRTEGIWIQGKIVNSRIQQLLS